MEKNLRSAFIQSLWIGSHLSNVEKLCIQSFIDHGHIFHLYTYEEINNVPQGAKIFDARSIMAEDTIFRFETGWGKGSVAGFADVFRLKLLQEKGGWWVDMDMVCLKPLSLDQDTIICSSHEGEYGPLANNCVIKAPLNSPFINYCIDQLAGRDAKKMTFGAAGPFLFQHAVKHLNAQEMMVPYQYFNPISWKFVPQLILGKMTAIDKIKELARPLLKPGTMPGRRLTPDSYTLHLWNEAWNAGRLDKNDRYSPGCLFEQLKRKHGIK